MKHVVTLLSVLVLVACGSTKEPTREQLTAAAQAQAETAISTAAFAGGNLKLAFDKDGQWQRITSTATAKILSEADGATDTAKTVATLKANRQIAEFLSTEVNSKRGLLTVAHSVQSGSKDVADPEASDVDDHANALAQKVRESIVQSSRAILRGGLIEGEYIDRDKRQAVVVVVVDRRTVDQVKKIRTAMGQP